MSNENDNRIQETHNKYTDAYVNILNTYKSQLSSSIAKKNELKEQFFKTIKIILYVLVCVFAGTLMASLILFIIMICLNYSSVAIITGAITTIFSSFTTMIISIYKLPEIIANYLFNKKEDKLMNEIIKNIQQYEIDAVKYEIERLKVEKIKKLNSETSETEDDNLSTSTYNIPSQDILIQADETSQEIINDVNS